MIEQAHDFGAESGALNALLTDIGDDQFTTVTQFKSWAFNDVLGHLHIWNHAAMLALTDEAALMAYLHQVFAAVKRGKLREFEREWLDGLHGVALREAWHQFSVQLADAYANADPKRRVKWAGPDMGARSAITARLMETWAHGQAIYDALGIERRDQDRIRNVAELGVRTYGWTFKNRGQKPPGPPPRITLTAPSGATWEWHANNASDAVVGSATEFCQVVTQTRNIADTGLIVTGDAARQWIAIAQCFAGPPETPPAPGSRRRATG